MDIDVDRAIILSFKCANQLTNAVVLGGWEWAGCLKNEKPYQKIFLAFLTKDRDADISQDMTSTALELEVSQMCAIAHMGSLGLDEAENERRRPINAHAISILTHENMHKNLEKRLSDLMEARVPMAEKPSVKPSKPRP